MGTAWLAWTCLMLSTGAPESTPAGADDVAHINMRSFQIPIRVEDPRDVAQLLLFVSRDQGRSWEIASTVGPEKKAFDHLANADGMLYFSIAVKKKNGHMDPPDVYKSKVGQKICIDTVKPVVRIVKAERMGDDVLATWEIQEERPDWTSWKLEYRVGDQPSGTWTPLPVQPSVRGTYRFRPYAPGSVTLRMVMRDLAGNEGSDDKVVGGGQMDHSIISTGAVAPAPTPVNDIAPLLRRCSRPRFQARRCIRNLPRRPMAQSNPPPAPISTSHGAENSGTTNTYGSYRGPLPALQIVNKDKVKLGFDVTKFGPSGLGGVDVYVTMNEGSTWEKVPGELPVSLPGAPDVRGAIRGNVTVAMSKEGVTYGFYLVVKSRAGLGKQPPRAGDPPQVRIELDATQPEARLFAPQPAVDRNDSLLLTWKADDRNLAANPVCLEWAASSNGPWSFIGESQLPNVGKYLWTVPMNAPAQVFLRLTVRDTAGNVAIAQTPQPVLIDLNQPEVGNVGIEH